MVVIADNDNPLARLCRWLLLRECTDSSSLVSLLSSRHHSADWVRAEHQSLRVMFSHGVDMLCEALYCRIKGAITLPRLQGQPFLQFNLGSSQRLGSHGWLARYARPSHVMGFINASRSLA